jgi:predicted DNA-binding ribbon-helix-helix protein
MHGKRVQFDDGTWLALDVLARDRRITFQELAEEAFNDLLDKYHRPANLKSALKQSAGLEAGARNRATGDRRRKHIKDGS